MNFSLLCYLNMSVCVYSAAELIFRARNNLRKHASILDNSNVLLLWTEFTLFYVREFKSQLFYPTRYLRYFIFAFSQTGLKLALKVLCVFTLMGVTLKTVSAPLTVNGLKITLGLRSIPLKMKEF